jgi:hypothetical protein
MCGNSVPFEPPCSGSCSHSKVMPPPCVVLAWLQIAGSLLSVTNRVLMSHAEQVTIADSQLPSTRGRALVGAGTDQWAQGAVRRIGSLMANTLASGAPPLHVSAVDKGTQRTLTVRVQWGVGE